MVPHESTVLLAARTDRPAPVAESRTLAAVDAVVPAVDSGPTDRVKVLYQVKRGDTLASIARCSAPVSVAADLERHRRHAHLGRRPAHDLHRALELEPGRICNRSPGPHFRQLVENLSPDRIRAAACTRPACARLPPDRRALRNRRLHGPRRGRRLVRPALLHAGRPARRQRPREPRPREERDPELRVRVSAASHHRQPGAGRRPEGRLGVRPADRARHPRRAGRRRAPRDRRRRGARASCRSTGRFSRRAGCCRLPPPRGATACRACCCPAPTPAKRPSSKGSRSCRSRRSPKRSRRSTIRRRRPSCVPARPPPPRDAPDLADVRGQLLARRALEIACAGGHNLLLVGPPGCRQDDDGAAGARDPAAADLRRSAGGDRGAFGRRAAAAGRGPGRASGRFARRTTRSRTPRSSAADRSRGRARSASRTTACCSSTRCSSSAGTCSKCCGSRSKRAASRSPARRGRPSSPPASSWSAR